MRYFFVGFLSFVSITLFGQDTTYYDTSFKPVNGIADANYYTIITKSRSDTNRATKKMFYKSGQLLSWNQYSSLSYGIRHGKQLEFYPDGKKKSEIDYNNGKYDGLVKTWYENGQLRRKDSFALDEFIKGNCYSSSGSDTTYFDYMVQPSYPGGENKRVRFLADNIIYPEVAEAKGIQGVVYLTFVVEKDGSLTNIELLKGPKELAAESIRVVKLMPNWNPGYMEGETVRVKINMPIKYLFSQ